MVLEKLRAQQDDEALQRFAPIAEKFKYKVPLEIGATDFKDDARIEITEVWGTSPKIVEGGQYIVRGKYVLPSHEKGIVYFHETATVGPGIGPELDLQHTTVRKGQGEFTLFHSMAEPGIFT